MTSKRFKKDRLLWIDLEMTGLFPERDTILEVAALVTNANLDVISDPFKVVINHPPEVFDRMDSWNQKHHTKSGLWDQVLASKFSTKDAERLFVDFLGQYFSEKEKALLAGNSIWQDRRFILKYMPIAHEYLHYRMVDVSSLKLLAKGWYPDLVIPKKRDVHRGEEDIEDSIEELRFYREKIFVKEDGKS